VLESPVGRVRAAGLVEGVSALVLFFVAMPLKYAPPAGSETAALGKDVVFWVGLVHGVLFITYATITFVAWGKGALTAKLVGLAAVASIVPFGPFVLDRKLKSHEERSKPQPDTADTPW
jgi:integral membrane protein